MIFEEIFTDEFNLELEPSPEISGVTNLVQVNPYVLTDESANVLTDESGNPILPR